MKGIADLLDSDMEDSTPFIDENSILSSASDATNTSTTKAAQAKRGKKRQRVTMPPKNKPKTQKAAPLQPNKAPPKQTAGVKRKAAEEHNHPGPSENPEETLEDASEEQVVVPAAKATKRARPTAQKPTAKVIQPQETEDDLAEVEEAPIEARSKHAANKTNKAAPKVTGKAPAAARSKAPKQFRSVITAEAQLQDEVETDAPKPLSPPKPRAIVRNPSRTRDDPPFRRRAGSASDTERGDPNLRRKLGDITRKFENVDLKYRNLKEVGINEANTNMEKLRKQCDATMLASNDLIASLKKELATQAPLAEETRKLKKQMQTQEEEMSKMRETTSDISNSLTSAQNEIKALQAKLAVARSSSVDASKTPASAIKSTAQRPLVMSNVEVAKAAEIAQMKLDLYSDLTGLVVLNVKKAEEGDTYECIQTGQNGSKYNWRTPLRSSTDSFSTTFPSLHRPRNCENNELRRH